MAALGREPLPEGLYGPELGDKNIHDLVQQPGKRQILVQQLYSRYLHCIRQVRYTAEVTGSSPGNIQVSPLRRAEGAPQGVCYAMLCYAMLC